MLPLLADAVDRAGFISISILAAGGYIILSTVWAWWTGELTIWESNGRWSTPSVSEIVKRYTNPEDFSARLRSRFCAGVGIIVIGIMLYAGLR